MGVGVRGFTELLQRCVNACEPCPGDPGTDPEHLYKHINKKQDGAGGEG